MESDFQHFHGCLSRACTLVSDKYFEIDVAGAENRIFRERVYCYELYHQLRINLGEDFPYQLVGELNKTNHPVLMGCIGGRIPDFLVHFPGQMDRNLVVMEVKPISERPYRIERDIYKLKLFLDEGRYYKAISLVYGNARAEVIERIHSEIVQLNSEQAPK